jgi:ribulose-5-phosphate 4-epimerase/fuculose-1-phosphate aldolase
MATQLKTNAFAQVGKPPIDCSEQEWQARLELAACYRIFDHMNWCEGIYNHITLRVPGERDAFLINPFGLMWDEVTASNLIKIDADGNKLSESPYPVNLAGFTQHGTFHRALDWAHAIVHTHTPDTMAVCCSPQGLVPSNFYSCFFEGLVGYHDFEGITVRPEEGERLVKNIGNRQVLMLRNHGPVLMGKTIYEMFFLYYMFQRACEVQVKSYAMGEPIIVPPEVIEVHQRDRDLMLVDDFGKLDFQAWTRRIDKIDSSWRN